MMVLQLFIRPILLLQLCENGGASMLSSGLLLEAPLDM
jgi:hypothetical protein